MIRKMENKRNGLLTIFKIMAAVSLLGLGSNLVPVSAAALTPFQDAAAKNRWTIYHAWINAPWTADDRPYQALRDTIEQALAGGRKPADVVNDYQKAAKQQPGNALARFGYYYALYQAAIMPNFANQEEGQKVGDLYLSIIKSPPPHTYNYSRLAFLCQKYSLNDVNTINIGRRLLKQDPKDTSVEYALATVLAYSDAPADFAQAVALQKDLARRFPDSPKTAWLLGDIYYHTAYRSHSQADAERCIAAYQHVLDVAPPTPETRNNVRVTVLFIRNLETRWKKG